MFSNVQQEKHLSSNDLQQSEIILKRPFNSKLIEPMNSINTSIFNILEAQKTNLSTNKLKTMLWNKNNNYTEIPYERESQLEDAVNEVKAALFGSNRIYLDDKKKIGKKGATNNLPDGYLIDLTDTRNPKLFVVENDLSSHQHLKHIAVQILEFSLSFETSKVKLKNIIKEMLQKRPKE